MRRIYLLALTPVAVVPLALAAAPEPPAPCVRPADYGARPDDGADDRAALQRALDAATSGPGCLELAPGRYDVTRRPEPGVAAIPSLVARGPLGITGAGATLALLGSGIRPGETAPGDWTLLEVSGPDVAISGVAFDGAGRTSTGEQTHLLQVRGPAERVTIERSSFNLPGPGAAGDCIRLLGEADRRVRGVTIRDVLAPACFRSFLGVQRGVHGLLVEQVETTRVGDQAIDFEPTGGAAFGCTPIISGVTIRDSVFRRGAERGITISVAGDTCALADDVTIADSVIEDGGIDLLDVGRVTLAGLRVENARGFDAQPTLLARKRVGALVVRDSTFVRNSHERPSPVVQVSAQGNGRPTFAAFSRVTLEQATPRSAIRVEGLGALVVRDARLIYRGAGPGDWAVSGSADSVTLADVEVSGAWRGRASMPATQLRVTTAP
jgi:hypothetical protein